ncbi:MAG: tetratricopeptide repeat protein [Marivibrio sp.]|uniref:tetratricopeptide repeat protein n=1 Tax=Marivibrio sp. TaxID=2039719 RepID=UPI0032EE9CA2
MSEGTTHRETALEAAHRRAVAALQDGRAAEAAEIAEAAESGPAAASRTGAGGEAGAEASRGTAAERVALAHVRAVALQRLGRGREAVELMAALTAEPPGADDPTLLNTYGYLLRLSGLRQESLAVLERATARAPGHPEALNNLAITLVELGRLEAAEEAYRRAIAAREGFAEAHANLGNLLARQGRLDAALAEYDAALALNPGYIDAYANKAEALMRAPDGPQREEALAVLTQALERAPGWAEGWRKRADLLHALDRAGEAVGAYERALALAPDDVRAHVNMGAALERNGDPERAAAHLRQALLLAPDTIGALKGLAHMTLKLGAPVEALSLLKQAMARAPADPDLLYSYGNALMRCERYQEAADAYARVRELQPDHPRGLFAPAALLLMDGQYERGWAAYESRFRMKSFKANVPDVHRGLWNGKPIGAKRLLVHVEQGFGDTLQFCRYLPLLRARVGEEAEITFLTEPALHPLMETLPGVDRVVHLQMQDVSVGYDLQVPLLSLPHRLGTTLETVPSETPYLSVPNDRRRALPKSEGARLAVVIVWAGRPNHSDDCYRSIPLHRLAPLFEVEGVDFHSVQLGPRREELAAYRDRPNVFDHGGEIADFADTAAILQAADLTISVDTSVAHLAGALGRPVWTLIAFGGEWRWLRGLETTPWYPTMRLFRQRTIGDWTGVVARVRGALSRLAEDPPGETL